MIAYRSAVVLAITTFAMLAVVLLGLIVNMTLVLLLQIPPNMEPGPDNTVMDRMAGILPYPVPAWAGFLPVASMITLLVGCWRPSRHKRISPVEAKLLLRITPRFIALLLFVTAAFSAACAQYYVEPDGSFSWWWVNVWFAAAGGVVAFIHGVRTAPYPFFTPRRKPRRG